VPGTFFGTAQKGSWHLFHLVPDYEAPGITWPAAAVALAGILGVMVVFASSYTLGRTAKARVPKK